MILLGQIWRGRARPDWAGRAMTRFGCARRSFARQRKVKISVAGRGPTWLDVAQQSKTGRDEPEQDNATQGL
jgi:hypothetical protein